MFLKHNIILVRQFVDFKATVLELNAWQYPKYNCSRTVVINRRYIIIPHRKDWS